MSSLKSANGEMKVKRSKYQSTYYIQQEQEGAVLRVWLFVIYRAASLYKNTLYVSKFSKSNFFLN